MYWFLRFISALFCRMKLETLEKFGGKIGTLAWYVLPERRNIAKINARIIGAENPDKVAKESFRHTFKSYLEIMYIPNVDDEFIKKYVTFENEHFYHELVNSHQHFAFISAHIGAWDLSSPITTESLGMKAVIVGRKTNNKALNRLIDWLRNVSGNIIYVQHHGYMAKINESERDGFIPGSLVDHVGNGKDSKFVPFFGKDVETIAGIATLAARKRIPMLPCYVLRTETGFHVRMNAPIWPDNSLAPKERINDLLVKTNCELENIIREYPEQWYLLHRRFKRERMPDGKISHDVYRPRRNN